MSRGYCNFYHKRTKKTGPGLTGKADLVYLTEPISKG
jgi:hypothetical protein